jgi:hypothetical protein
MDYLTKIKKLQNRCGYTIWPGIFGRNGIPFNGGLTLNPGYFQIEHLFQIELIKILKI